MGINILTQASPFHRGEQHMQQTLGVREQLEHHGKRVIRDYLPEQHRRFYANLPFLLLGHVDENGWPWASIVCASEESEENFIESPDDQHLHIKAMPLPGDPLGQLENQQRIAVLGIDPGTRRRNRLSGTVAYADSTGINIAVDQTFGNCPQYIQQREVVTRPDKPTPSMTPITHLSEQEISLIGGADTFFVASSTGPRIKQSDRPDEIAQGVDISHRGGQPGFVKVSEDSLYIPDFPGNNYFNTLGNFVENPKAGLLFIDFESGDVLMLTGKVTIHSDNSLQPHFKNADRFWSFQFDHGMWLKNALSLSFWFASYSPSSLLSGTWEAAESTAREAAKGQAWQTMQVVQTADETPTIRSFYLQPENGDPGMFKAGQSMTVRVNTGQSTLTGTYPVSSAPGESFYRISVKRGDVLSYWLLDHLEAGDQLMVQPPTGHFNFNALMNKPAVMIADGVGISPMISMIRHNLRELMRLRMGRALLLFACVNNETERAFFHEIEKLSEVISGLVQVVWVIRDPTQPAEEGTHHGCLSEDLLELLLKDLTRADYYLCGPAGFVQNAHSLLKNRGVEQASIHSDVVWDNSVTQVTKAVVPNATFGRAITSKTVAAKTITAKAITSKTITSKNKKGLSFLAKAMETLRSASQMVMNH